MYCINEHKVKPEMDTPTAKAAIRKLAKLGCKRVTFTGGEPLLREDLFELLAYCRRFSISRYIITNGTLITESNIRQIRNLVNGVGLSLDSIEPAAHNAQRSGSHSRAMNAFRLLKQNRIPTVICTTITRLNVGQAFQTMLDRMASENIEAHIVNLPGNLKEKKQTLGVSAMERQKLLRKLAPKQTVGNPALSSISGTCAVNPDEYFLSCDGFLYPCTEIYQENPANHLGALLEITEWNLLDFSNEFRRNTRGVKCSFNRISGPSVTLIDNDGGTCPNANRILTLQQLYSALYAVLSEWKGACAACKDCCTSYGWLLKREAKEYERSGKEIIEFNNRAYCIDSFPKGKEREALGTIPRCKYYRRHRCNTYPHRPLFCRMYPIQFDVLQQNSVEVSLDPSCEMVKRMNPRDIKKLKRDLKTLFASTHPDLLAEVIEMHREVSKITRKEVGSSSLPLFSL